MKTLQTTLIAIFAICLASCNSNSKAEDQIDKIVAAYDKIPKIIDGVTDVESAKKANTELATLGTELGAIMKELKTMKVTSSKKEELEKLLADKGKEFQAAIKEKSTELAKKDPMAAMEIGKGLLKMAATMQAASK